MSPYRVWARQVIDQVIADNVHGPVGCLKSEDIRDLRRVLYQAAGFPGRSAWEQRILREEFRASLGYPTARKPKMRRIRGTGDVMPAMRDWAISHGLIAEPEHPPEPQTRLL